MRQKTGEAVRIGHIIGPPLGSRLTSVRVEMKTSTPVRTFVLEDFEDRRLDSLEWDRILSMGDTNTVFLTAEWQRTWWKVFHPGAPLLIVAEKERQPVALAPMFALGGMAFLAGSGSSDYLDLIGNVDDPEVLDGILQTARENIDDFVGFRFHHVPERSRTGRLLAGSADRLGLGLFNEGSIPVPVMTMGVRAVRLLLQLKRRAWFGTSGSLTGRADSKFAISRVGRYRSPSRKLLRSTHCTMGRHRSSEPVSRRQATPVLRGTGGVCRSSGMAEIHQGRLERSPIAFHFGFHYGGRYLWYKPSFDIGLARRSPGEVLLRNLLLAAVEEKAAVFDFGLGDEPFKSRFATKVENVHTWALYTPDAVRKTKEGSA